MLKISQEELSSNETKLNIKYVPDLSSPIT